MGRGSVLGSVVGGFTFSVLYEISHFLYGRNIPFAICSKTIEKITVRLKSYAVIGVNSKRAGARLGKCRRRGGGFIPVAAPPVVWVFAKSDRKHVLLICLNIFSHLFH